MHELTPTPHPETKHETLIAEAISLMQRYERDDAIWQALSNLRIEERSERMRLFRLIKTELIKREARDLKQIRLEKTISETLRREQLLQDARAHELRQPRDTWDPTYDPDEKMQNTG